MIANPYIYHLNIFFTKLIELRHTTSHINSVLNESIKNIQKLNNVDFISGSALIISDWTGPTDKGWTINYHTGISKIVYKKDYKNEVERIISFESSYAFAQSFEALEKLFKDFVFAKSTNSNAFYEKMELHIKKGFKRHDLPGGEKIFSLIKLAAGKNIKRHSETNNRNIKFKEFWTILSHTRHAVTHSNCIIKMSLLSKTQYHFAIFEYFFDQKVIDKETIEIKLNYKKLDVLIKAIAEFGFQVFKAISLSDNFEWNILSKNK